jgi:predicted RNase H-like nuclease
VTRSRMLVGVDGCRGGWLAVVEAKPGTVEANIHETFAALIEAIPQPALIAVDIPMGLSALERRLCDQEARDFLGDRRSSVFYSPVRTVLPARSHFEASRLSVKAIGKKVSIQTFCILEKIREVDDCLTRVAGLRERVVEVHPEVSFAVWNGGPPLKTRKRKAEGKEQRRAMVEKVWPGAVEPLREGLRGGDYGSDDLLDAFAALWSARRIASGTARVLGDVKVRDARGLPMVIRA